MFQRGPHSQKTVQSLWRLEKLILDSLDFNHVVQQIVDGVLIELGFLKMGYEIMVLTLIDDKKHTLERISISKTKKAQLALQKSPVPFHQISIPLDHKDNILVKAVNTKQPQTTTDWRKILHPAFTEDDALKIQHDLGIKASLVYPVTSQNKTLGALIFSMSKQPQKVTSAERDLISNFSDIVGLAVQNSSLYSQLETANHKLTKANRHLKQLDKLKDEFVFIATHELKTPVTVMKGYMSMINDGTYGEVPEKIKEALGEIDQANSQLVQLVGDLLEIARAEAKTIKINTVPTPIYDIIKANLDNLKALAEQKGLKLNYQTLPNNKVMVMADPDRIKEIVNNLVSNAIKYSETGTITLSHESDGKSLTTHVTDQGHGISEPDQAKIFSRFFRAEATAGQPGTGLGLFIVKQIVEKMGGKIWFQSKLGEGTTFSFSLPLDGAQQLTDFKKSQPKH